MPTVSVTTENTTTSYEIEENEVIYEALERQGVILPHGCLAGSCGACKIKVIEGQENLKAPKVIELDTIEHVSKTYIEKNGSNSLDNTIVRLSCRARATGDIKISPL